MAAIAYACLILLTFAYIGRKSFAAGLKLPQYAIPAVFVLKLLASFLLVYVFTRYYPDREKADLFKYFDAGNVLYSSLADKPIYYVRIITGIDGGVPDLFYYYDKSDYWLTGYPIFNDSRTVIRLHAIIRLFSSGSVHVHNAAFSVLGLFGSVFLYQSVLPFFKRVKPFILMGFVFLLPSVLFWTSSATKEAVLLFGFGLYIRQFLRLNQQPVSVKNCSLFLLSLGVLMLTKYYVLLCLLVPSIVFYVASEKKLKPHIKTVSLMFLIPAALFMLYHYAPWLLQLLTKKRNEFIELALSQQAGSLMDSATGELTAVNAIHIGLKGMFAVFFRPFFFELKNSMYVAPIIETLLFMLMLFRVSLHFRAVRAIQRQKVQLVVFLLLFSLQLGFIIGLGVPVLGAVVRYRLPVYLALFVAFLLILDESPRLKWKHFFKHLSRTPSKQ